MNKMIWSFVFWFSMLSALSEGALAQWVQTNGPFGGTVTCLAVSGSEIFIGTSGAGVFRSTNNGANWTAVNNGLTDSNISALTVSGTNLFAGTYNGVFRSTDNGANWTALNNGPIGSRVLVVNGTNLFAGTYWVIYRSTDNGDNWTAAATGPTYYNIGNALIVKGTDLFAGTQGGNVFRSTNNGDIWTQSNIGDTFEVVSFASNSTDLYAATIGGGVYRSIDNGAHWTTVNNGLPIDGYGYVYIYTLAVSGSNLFAGTSDGVYRSTDNGANWTAENNGLINEFGNPLVTVLAASSGNLYANSYYGSGTGGLFRSTDNGANWMAMNNGLTNSIIRSLAVNSAYLFAGTWAGVFRSANNGDNWTAVNNGLTNGVVQTLAVSGTDLFAGTWGGGIFRSTDNGDSWAAVNTGLTTDYIYFIAVNSSSIYASTYGGVFRSTDNGDNWTAANNGLTNPNVFALSVSSTDLFAGTYGDGVFHSTDNGDSWAMSNSGLTNDSVRAFAVKGINLFAATMGGGVCRSTDNGAHWIAVNNGLTNSDVRTLLVNGTDLYAGTYYGGVFRSTDNGNNWIEVNDGLSNRDIRAFAVSGTNLFTGTWGGGVWRFPLPDETPIVPIVLVHGWTGDAGKWSSMIEWLHDDGYPYVWPVQLNSCGTPEETGFKNNTNLMYRGNAKILADYIDGQLAILSPDIRSRISHIDIVAHSMGGLVARRYLSYIKGYDTWTPISVRNLIMLGTPNIGSEAAGYGAKSLWCNGPAAQELGVKYMKKFNSAFPDNPNTSYYTAWGKGGCVNRIQCNELCNPITSRIVPPPNDGVVTRTSAIGGYSITAGTWLCHGDFPSDRSLYNLYIRPILNGTLPLYRAEPVVDSSVWDTSQICYEAKGSIGSGAIISDSFSVEGNSNATICIFASDSNVAFSLTSPSHINYDSTATTQDSSILFITDTNGIAGFHINNAEPGKWQWHVNSNNATTSPVDYTILATYENSIIITGHQNLDYPKGGDTLLLAVKVVDGMAGMTGLSVMATPIWNESDTAATVAFYDDGQHRDGSANDGIYAATITSFKQGVVAFNTEVRGNASSGKISRLLSYYAYVERSYVCGDSNDDSKVNVGDAVFLINYVFKGGSAPNPLAAGDANADGHVNVGDAVYLINYVFKGGPDPKCP